MDVSQDYPKVVRHASLFLIEFNAMLEGETHSLPAPLRIGLSQFGEMMWIQTDSLKSALSASALDRLKEQAKTSRPPMQVVYESVSNRLRLGLLEGAAYRERAVGGILILDNHDCLASIVVSLR